MEAEAICEGRQGKDKTEAKKVKPQIKRNRIQTSCTECHRRKQSCDREVPCSRCIKRGIEHLCIIPVKGTNGVEATTAITKRLVRVENFIRSGMPSGWDLNRALDTLVKSADGGSDDNFATILSMGTLLGGDNWYYMGPGSIVSLLNQANACKSLQNVQPRTGFDEKDYIDAVERLPSRELADYLVDRFYEMACLKWLFPIPNWNNLRQEYGKIWFWKEQYQNDIQCEPQFSLGFVSYILSTLAIAVQSYLPTVLPPPPTAILSPSDLADDLHQGSREVFIKSESHEPPHLIKILTLLLTSQYSKNSGRGSEHYELAGHAIRMAQSMGMHREAADDWKLSPFEREWRRRVWWSIYCYDRFQNLGFCRPYAISDIHCDVQLPTNVDLDVFLTEDVIIDDPPLSKPSEVTPLLLRIPVAKLAGEILDTCCAPTPPSYDNVLEIDKKINQLDVEFPVQLRVLTPLLEAHLNVQIQLCLMELHWVRTVLHRPFLLRPLPSPCETDPFIRSRLCAIGYPKKLIILREELEIDFPKHQSRFFLFGFYVLEACFTLCLAILHEPTNFKQIADLDVWVKRGRDVLLSMESLNACAEGVIALEALRQKYLNPSLASQPTISLPYFGVSSANQDSS